MVNKITIRDVAEKAGVSISTVHQALNGKKGVGEETRARIQTIAAQLGYQPNPMASSLKRKTKHIAILFPQSTYYKTVWAGTRDYLKSVPSMNLESSEIPFHEDHPEQEERERALSLIREDRIDGILMSAHSDFFTGEEWSLIRNKPISISLVGADRPVSHRVYCVQPDYDVIGRTMAELIMSHIPSFGSIVMCAGNPDWEPHAEVVKGFQAFLKEAGAANRVYYNHSWNKKDESYIDIIRKISQPDVAACCSVLSQSSVLLGRALIETGKAGKVFAVGSDLSKENIAYLQEGTFSNLIQKNPYAQGYLGAKNLAEYLMLGRQPDPDKVYVGSEVVFRSNISMYRNRNFRSLLQ